MHTVPALFTADDGIIGGAERYVLELARHMADRVPTTLVTFGNRAREEEAGRLRVRVIGSPWHVRGQAANPFSLKLLPAVLGADVIHCHQQHIVTSSVSAAAARLTGRRVFCSDLGGGGFDISTYVSTDAWFHGHLHISEYSRHVFGHDGLPTARVIWGGVDTAKFAPADVARTGRVLFVGRVLPHKGVDSLVRALPPGLALDIVGQVRDGQYLDDLRRLAAGKDVSFHHDWDDRAIVRAYQSALCIVLPSVYDTMYGHHTAVPELLGQTLIEGMACGTPAIGTRVASIPEIIDDGVNGFLVPQNDPDALRGVLSTLAGDPALAARMGEAARQRVLEKFTWTRVVDACLAAYAA
ncbi:MAG: glycosyltransferase family 4 protein [Vicinamibacterales bacterium]